MFFITPENTSAASGTAALAALFIEVTSSLAHFSPPTFLAKFAAVSRLFGSGILAVALFRNPPFDSSLTAVFRAELTALL